MDVQRYIDALRQLSQDLQDSGVDKHREVLSRVHWLIHELEALGG
jgi:hypothetical protein